MADLSDSVNWFEVDASNNKASPNGWPEGMMPSGVNDSARADKGALKRFWDRINPVQRITPAGGAYTFVTSNPSYPTSYVDGEVYCFRPLLDSAGGEFFQVNALGTKPIWKRVSVGSGYAAIAVQDIIHSLAAQLIYDASLNGGSGVFILLNPFMPVYSDGTGAIIAGGPIFTNGPVISTGANAGLGFEDRHNSASQWLWYADAGTARLYLGGDKVAVSAAGGLSTAGDVTAGGWLRSSGNITLAQTYIYFAGGTGAVNTTGGPLLFADNNNHVYKQGSGDGSWLFQNYAGTNVASFSSAGSLNLTGALTAPSISISGLVSAGSINASGIITGVNFSGANYFIGVQGAAQAGTFGFDNGNGPGMVCWGNASPGAGTLQSTIGGAVRSTLSSGGLSVVGDITASINLRSAAGLFLGNPYILFNGNLDLSQGPYISFDSTNFAARLGAGNGSFVFYNSANAQLFGVDNGGGAHVAGSLYLATTTIYFNGNTSTAQGPFIYGDANDFIFNIGSNTGSWRFEKRDRTQVAQIDANGDIYANGVLRGGNGQDAGVLRGMATADVRRTIAFAWDGTNSTFYKITDNSRTDMLIWSDTIRAQILAVDGGTPSGWHLSVFSGGTSFAIYVDFTVSDARMKRGIGDSKVDALAAICAVPVRRFEWRKEVQTLFGVPQGPVAIGLVAQDLLPHMPDCVGISEGREKPYPADTHTLMYDRIHAYTIRAIQQLEARIAQLEAK